jgi:cell division protease FtsH
MSRSELRGQIVGALGGRAAEEIVSGELTTGAERDLERATRLARMMVERWGMSEALGPVSALPPDGAVPGTPLMELSDDTRRLIDQEVRDIVDSAYEEAVTRLREHRDRLDRLAAALLEHESLDEADVYRIAADGGRRATAAPAGPA